MAEMENKAHVIEIPVDEDDHHRSKKLSAVAFDDLSAIQHHPFMEISRSPGHLLLLKLWQREEERSSRRISLKEAQLDGIKSQVFLLCCFFFAFHAFTLIHLFTTSAELREHARRKWWVVASLSLVTSLVLIFFVQLGLCRYRRVLGKLQRERSDGRALGRCVQELRMKGASFDLNKEPLTTKRLKSSSVEVQWRSLRWCVENAVTICLVCFTGLVVPAGKFVLCS